MNNRHADTLRQYYIIDSVDRRNTASNIVFRILLTANAQCARSLQLSYKIAADEK